jgi:hypothetical protein
MYPGLRVLNAAVADITKLATFKRVANCALIADSQSASMVLQASFDIRLKPWAGQSDSWTSTQLIESRSWLVSPKN